MAFRKPTKTAERNWSVLTEEDRFAAVMWAAQRLRAKADLLSLGKSVTRLGFGRRERHVGGKRRVMTEPVLA